MSQEKRLTDCYLSVDWPAPDNVQAFVATRKGGVGKGAFGSLNLSLRSGDTRDNVLENRRRVVEDWGWEKQPCWLKQVHGTQVVDVTKWQTEPEADASVSMQPGAPAIVLTADCLPVLFCNDRGTCVAAAHAGWKGLVAGVLENTITSMDCAPSELMAWLGPAISQPCFEVGPEVRDAFIDVDANAKKAFIAGAGDRWMADLYLLARQRLERAGLSRIYGGDYCTFQQDELFFSYRRDGRHSGRMASAVWIKE